MDGRLRNVQVGRRLAQGKDSASDSRVVCTDLRLLFRGLLNRTLPSLSQRSRPAILAALAVAPRRRSSKPRRSTIRAQLAHSLARRSPKPLEQATKLPYPPPLKAVGRR